MSQGVMSLLQKSIFSTLEMTLKVVITPLHLLFGVVFYVDDKFCVKNINILANMRRMICLKGRLIFSSTFATFLGCGKPNDG